MNEKHCLVVPVDFLETTARLVDYAALISEKLSMTVHFIHVVDFYAGDSMLGAPYAQECEERLFSNAEKRMSNLLTDNSERCPGCSGEVVIGDPVDKITDIARKKDASLIILSTHGAKGLEKILLGSVAERVLKRAHCDVLVMKPFKK